MFQLLTLIATELEELKNKFMELLMTFKKQYKILCPRV